MTRDEAFDCIVQAAKTLDANCKAVIGVHLGGLTGPIQLGGPGSGTSIPAEALASLASGADRKPMAWVMRDWKGGKIDVTLLPEKRDDWARLGLEVEPLYPSAWRSGIAGRAALEQG